MSLVHPLVIGPGWTDSVATLREAVTDRTNLRRPDGKHYRICRDTPGEFTMSVTTRIGSEGSPAWESPPLMMKVRYTDLYATRIGEQGIVQYDHYLLEKRLTFGVLDACLHASRTAQGDGKLLSKQSVMVFLVCESLRSDFVAEMLAPAVEVQLSGTDGGTPAVDLASKALLQQKNSWGQASDAIHMVLRSKGKALRIGSAGADVGPDVEFKPQWVEFAFQGVAQRMSVLKRPNL